MPCSATRSTSSSRSCVAEGDTDLENKTIDGESVGDFVKGMSGTLGEKMGLGRVVRFETTDGLIDGYKHIQNERGTIGVLVELGGVDAANAQARAVAHDVALHIANKSTAPRYVTRDEFPADVVEAERQFHEKQTREEGKPEAAWPKIVEGKMTGFFKNTGRAARAGVREGQQADDRSSARNRSAVTQPSGVSPASRSARIERIRYPRYAEEPP